MSRPEDFIIAVRVNQDGVDTYTRELGGLEAEVIRIQQQINATRLPGLSFRADSSLLRRRLRTEVERRQRDKTRVVSSMARTATALQKQVVKETERSLVRKSASTGALAALTGSPRNLTATNTFFGVGDIPVLATDRKVGYALAIEAGTAKHVGRVLTGVWVGSRGGAYGFGAPNPNQRFVAMSTTDAQALLRKSHRRAITRGIIKRAIQPHNAYRAAVQSFQPQQKMATEIRRIYGF